MPSLSWLTTPAADVQLVALATMAHVAAAALRNHHDRSAHAISSLAFVSALLGVMPWLFSSATGLVLGLIVQAAWYSACSRLAGSPPVAAPAQAVPPGRAAQAAPRSVQRPVPPPGAVRVPPAAVERPRGFVPVSVLQVIDETPDIRTVRFTRPDGFEFEAGQFVALRMRTDGRELVRCYSISSAPAVPGYLEISVKRLGVVSNALHAMARAGAQLAVKAPAGAFRYPSSDDRPMLLLAGGVGITPLMSMLRHAVVTDPSRPVTLIYSVRRLADIAFRHELAWLASRYSQLRVQVAVSHETAGAPFYPGRIDAALMRALAPDAAHSVCMICGPNPMMDAMKGVLGALGVPPDQVRSELFEAAVAASTRAGSPDVGVTAGAAAQLTAAVPVTPGAGGGFQVIAAKSGTTMNVSPGRTLLEAAEDHGVMIPSLCRAGVCGTCRVQVSDGYLECTSAMLDDQDRADGMVLACATTVNGNAVIEA